DRGRILADRNVDAEEVLALLVDDRVEEDRRLACEAVADDQLALAAADRDHGVDRLDTRLHRAVDSLACDDARSDPLHGERLAGLDRPLVVERNTEWVDDAAEQLVADRDLEQATCGLDLVAFVQVAEVAEDDGPHLVFFEVQGQPVDLVRKFEQLARHRVLQAVDLGDAVAHGDDSTYIGRHEACIKVLEPLFDDFRDLFGADSHSSSPIERPAPTWPPSGGAAAPTWWPHSRRRPGLRTEASARR